MISPYDTSLSSPVWNRIQHGYGKMVNVDQPIYVKHNVLQDEDIHIAHRLLKSFVSALAYERDHLPADKRPDSGLWLMIRNAYHQHFYEVAESGDVEKFASLLVNALHTPVCFGLGPGPGTVKAISSAGTARDELVLTMVDNVISCAEALGVLGVENPEQGTYGDRFQIPLSQICKKIEEETGRPFSRPAYMGMTGLFIDGRIIDNRLADDTYCSRRIIDICRQQEFHSVCEIGGGFGGLAFEMFRSGCQKYTIFDLPIINVIQSFFLIKAAGLDSVRLYGEEHSGRSKFDIFPYWEFFDGGKSFDFVVNRDSMAEMPEKSAIDYLLKISRERATFLSINQEAMADTGDRGIRHVRVSDLAGNMTNMSRISRQRYWMRRGYVEELYLPSKIS